MVMPGLPELIIIGLVVVLLFGASKLPKLGGAIGESIKNFKKGINDPKALENEDDKNTTKASDEKNSAKPD